MGRYVTYSAIFAFGEVITAAGFAGAGFHGLTLTAASASPRRIPATLSFR